VFVVAQSEEEVAALVAEANFFSLVSHLCWGLASTVMGVHTMNDFDHTGYIRLRMAEYYRRKDEYIQALQPYLRG